MRCLGGLQIRCQGVRFPLVAPRENMTEEEQRLAWVAKYNDWKKTQKTLYMDYEHIHQNHDGTVLLLVRTGDHDVKVGDVMGGAKVLKCEAYGKVLDRLCCGMTGGITVDKMPYLTVEESYRE